MKRNLALALLLLCSVAVAGGCSRRFLEPPVERPSVIPERRYRTEETDLRTPYMVDQPLTTQRRPLEPSEVDPDS